MDGNGRWAKKRFLPRIAGHRAGVETVRRVVEACAQRGVEVLTLFAFSSENWRRPPQEVSLLMELFMLALDKQTRSLHRNNVRLRVIGDRDAFGDRLRDKIAEAEALTHNNTGLQLLIAANYGGRWDMVQAMRQLAEQVRSGTLEPAAIDEARISLCLSLSGLPAPDLFIRTGGERRISNFLLWDLAYAELYFTDVPWPDFDEAALTAALESFAIRERRFGQTSEQVQGA